MITLHIEHPITDYTVWKAAFDRFAGARRDAGVLRHQVRRPVDDPAYVVVDLSFATADRAEGFLEFLRTRVWASPERAPALVGTPVTRVLAVEEDGEG
ncbi:hypothetical protein [Streptomyces sp. WAC01280]|uniref:hypothetical protein n=1 Tax=Streptomyces sp. WAC01280 TaxID=2487424 RepID=UPI000F7A7EC8|nr:hypothetical protein [Streptomyces sp. WAC01280]RSS57017.1 hypothetical protein EF909_13355 [Streptomyces sp. WAC01280]